MSVVSLDQVLAHPTLPSLPAVAMEVLALASRPSVNLEEVATVIQHDQALTAKILRTVNSSFYGLTTPCPTITRAISYLGLNTVKSLMLGFSLVDWSRFADDGFDLMEFWRTSLLSATATRSIALSSGLGDPEEAFIAALMQDIGMTAIHSVAGAEYDRLIAQAQGDHQRLTRLEREAFGFDHAQAGAQLMKRWRLPAEMIEAVRHHHTPERANAHHSLVRAVALGAMAAEALNDGQSPESVQRFATQANEWFNLNDDGVQQMLSDVSREAATLNHLFRIRGRTTEEADLNAIRARADEISLQHQLSVERETQELREHNLTLARQAVTDALTGVGNRKLFDTDFPALFQRALCTGGALGVIMLDADRFKDLNDTHGHQAGDAVLIELARRMQMHMKEPGFMCRYGGEEFVAVLPEADRRSAARIAEAIRVAVAATPMAIHGGPGATSTVPVTVTAGVAVLDSISASRLTSPDLLIKAADMALYAAKQAGRNCVRVFTPQAQAVATQTHAPTPAAA